MTRPLHLSRRHCLALGLAGAASAILAPRLPAEGKRVLVAAASDLRFALDEITRAWRTGGHGPVEIVYGSSGNLARQIRQGAPFEIFMSADERYVLDLARDGLLPDAGRIYALGRLALVLPPTSPLEPDGTLADLAAALADGRLRRLAIANPEHAPYGERAREALETVGLWERIRPHLVYGENVAQALTFALSGGTQGGLVAHSLALAPPVAHRVRTALVPQTLHSPLRQRMALTNGAGDAARSFYAHLASPEARAVLVRYGFSLPTDASDR